MKKLLFAITALLAVAASAQVTIVDSSQVALTDSDAFFPLLYMGSPRPMLMYSSYEAARLMLKQLDGTATQVVVSDKGFPGFSGRFTPDGKVCYVTMQRGENNLIYRTGHLFDPVTGRDKVVLKPQHGAVKAIVGSKGVAIVGEKKSWNLKKAGLLCWTQGPNLYVARNGKVRTLHPVGGVTGYLWSSVSPDGSKIAFVAAGKGLYVCDLNGKVLYELGLFLMPCWLGNNHIVAMSNSGNIRLTGSHIYVMSIDGKRTDVLVENARAVQPATVGNRVVYTTREGQVHWLKVKVENDN